MYTEGDNGFTAPELLSYHLQGNVYGHSRFDDGVYVILQVLLMLLIKVIIKKHIQEAVLCIACIKRMLILSVKRCIRIIMRDLGLSKYN